MDYENIEYYLPGNEEMSESITQNWTDQAIECYSINCDCRKCSIRKGHYSFVCQMSKVVDALLKEQGVPRKALKTA